MSRAEPTKVSDITITRIYEVYCEDHGCVDAPRSYRDALKSRRRHLEIDHPRRREETR